MIRFRDIFYLVWFTAFLVFWGSMMFTKPEYRILSISMFILHIFLVAFYLNIFVKNIIKKGKSLKGGI